MISFDCIFKNDCLIANYIKNVSLSVTIGRQRNIQVSKWRCHQRHNIRTIVRMTMQDISELEGRKCSDNEIRYSIKRNKYSNIPKTKPLQTT